MRFSLYAVATSCIIAAGCGPNGPEGSNDSNDYEDMENAGGAPRAVANGPQVTFSVDLTAGPARQFKPPAAPAMVSSHIYGINGFGTFVAQKTKWGLIRQGGNAFTAWNWTNNYSNSGADYCFWQGPKTGGAGVAEWLTAPGDSITAAQLQNES